MDGSPAACRRSSVSGQTLRIVPLIYK